MCTTRSPSLRTIRFPGTLAGLNRSCSTLASATAHSASGATALAEDDEYFVRRRIHRDVRAALAEPSGHQAGAFGHDDPLAAAIASASPAWPTDKSICWPRQPSGDLHLTMGNPTR